MTNGQTKRRILRTALVIFAVLAVLALVAVSVWYALYWRGRVSLFENDNSIDTPESLVDNAEEDGKLITYKGETYRYNESAVSLLFMGVDKSDINADGGYGKNGQADSLFLAVMDTDNGAVKIIPLSRESMVDINLYDANGTFLGIEQRQLCLAYAYGADAAEGCENTIRSVGRMLYGMPINGYVAIDFDGVKALNKAVGGVEVSVLEDIEIYHEGAHHNLVKGQKTRLNDITVLPYVQRRGNDVGANDRRMQRQKQFLDEFIGVTAKNVKKNFTLLEKYYNAVKPYAVSDLSLSKITYLTGTYLVGGQPAVEYLSVTGESKLVGEHVAFYPDQESLYETVLTAFYTKE